MRVVDARIKDGNDGPEGVGYIEESWADFYVMEDRDVPVNERYFAGGDGSVRGFERNSLSPLDEDKNPKGGRALAEVRAEVRFHVWRRLRAVVFADAGQSFDDFDALKSSLLEVGVGGGLRLATPVGVVRLDVAGPLTQDGSLKYYFGVGQAF